jgi:ribosomal silencing factor RsfS
MAEVKEISSEELALLVVKGMQERKGLDIVLMDLRKVKNAFVLVRLIPKLMQLVTL